MFRGRYVEEMGSGTGNHVSMLLANGANHVVAVDNDPLAIDLLGGRFRDENWVTDVQANGFKRRAAAHVSVVLYSLVQQFTSSLTTSRRLVALLDRACVSKADVVIEIVDINLHRKSSIAIFFEER